MRKLQSAVAFAAAVMLAAGCARYTQSSAGGEVADASKTVLLNVTNSSNRAMELRTYVNGEWRFVGSVFGNESTSIALDPTEFPTGFLYVTATPADGRGRAVAGPLSASKGDRILFTIEPSLDLSHAIVVR